jgi:hypothetical protein
MAASPTAAYIVWHFRISILTQLLLPGDQAVNFVAARGRACSVGSSLCAQAPWSGDAPVESHDYLSRIDRQQLQRCHYYITASSWQAICCSAPGWPTHVQHSSRDSSAWDYYGSFRHRTGGCSNSSRQRPTQPLVATRAVRGGKLSAPGRPKHDRHRSTLGLVDCDMVGS